MDQKKVDSDSQLGHIVDMPFNKFKGEVVRQKVNLGTINNLILMLEGTYHELRLRKDAVMDLILTRRDNGEEVQGVLEDVLIGLYAEMAKLEQKILYLKERSKKLIKEGNTFLDSV